MDVKTYTSAEFAEMCGSTQRTVSLWAQKNAVHYVGEGRRKTYIFTVEDIERFNSRPKPGRRWPNK
jgi:DNA-binding transcriptional MerR regulator